MEKNQDIEALCKANWSYTVYNIRRSDIYSQGKREKEK